MRTIDRLYLLWVVLTLGIPFAVGFLVGGSVARGLEAMVWAGLLRIFLYQHATFSVNSICHMFGRKDYASRDEARNNWVIAALVLGEGWHNNHHAFPGSARHGLHRWQIDGSWLVIRGLEKLGLAWNVRRPTPEQMARRRIQPRGLKPLELVRDELGPAAGARERQRRAPRRAEGDRMNRARDQLVGALDAVCAGALEASA